MVGGTGTRGFSGVTPDSLIPTQYEAVEFPSFYDMMHFTAYVPY